jgi:hypothetical protein
MSSVREVVTNPTNEGCVKALEEALQMAKDGQITSVGIAALVSGKATYTNFCGQTEYLLGAVSMLSHEINLYINE